MDMITGPIFELSNLPSIFYAEPPAKIMPFIILSPPKQSKLI